MAEATHDIEIRNLYKIFGRNGERHVADVKAGMTKDELKARHDHVLGLDNINMTVPAGRIQVVMGLSGSGKSTLIRHINRLIDPTAGEVIFDNRDVVQMSQSELRQFRRQKTAMVFQKFALFPHRTVLENTTYGLAVQGVKPREAEERARRRALQEAQIASDGIVLDAGTLAASGAAPGPSRRLSGKERFMEAASIAAHDIAQAGAIGDPARTIVQGTSLDAVLETAISTELPGIVRAAISQDVWSWDGSAVLLPKGTRLIGRYNADVSIAQARAQVAWSRAVTPEGVSVALGGYGADAIGRSGQEDGELDTRVAERFGSAALISLISLAPNLAAGSDANSQDAVEQVGDDARRTTQNVMAEYLRLSPVIYVDQGARISVIVNRDLVF